MRWPMTSPPPAGMSGAEGVDPVYPISDYAQKNLAPAAAKNLVKMPHCILAIIIWTLMLTRMSRESRDNFSR
jgi:hypothetical protein